MYIKSKPLLKPKENIFTMTEQDCEDVLYSYNLHLTGDYKRQVNYHYYLRFKNPKLFNYDPNYVTSKNKKKKKKPISFFQN